MKNKYTLKEIKSSLPAEKNKADPLIVQVIIRPVSYYFTWFFLRTRLTPNHVSYLAALVCIISSLMLAFGDFTVGLLGAIGLNTFSILDAVDGNMARVQKRANQFGDWADAVGGYIAYATALPAASIAASKLYSSDLKIYSWILISGFLAALFTLLTRVIHQKYVNSSGGENEFKSDKQTKMGLLRYISKEIGLTGLLLPFILIGFIFNALQYVVVFYAFYYFIGLGGVLLRYIWKVEKH